MKQLRTSLMCSHCFKHCSVKITYLKNSTIELTCENCGYTTKVSPDLTPTLSSSEWKRRLITKPIRTALEIKRDPIYFVYSLPLRVITKPVRIARELEKI